MKRILNALALLLFSLQVLQAHELSLRMEFEKGQPHRIVIQADLEAEAWLGLSWYPYGVTDAYAEGEHQVIRLSPGENEQIFRVPARMLGGSVECALWKVRVTREECPTQCQWCTDNGFHLEKQQGYLYGSLAKEAE